MYHSKRIPLPRTYCTCEECKRLRAMSPGRKEESSIPLTQQLQPPNSALDLFNQSMLDNLRRQQAAGVGLGGLPPFFFLGMNK